MKRSISRRDFLKLSAFGTGAAGLAALVDSTATAVHAAQSALHDLSAVTSPTSAPNGPKQVAPNMPRPTFTPMSSALTYGQPVDVSMGWDGTVWSTDPSGALHTYDPINKAWSVFDAGIDAAAADGDIDHPILFKGNQVWRTATNSLQTIAQAWPNLPTSFKLGVEGAASTPDGLFLFKPGRYVNVNDPTVVMKLTDLKNWDSITGPDGAFDYVMSGPGQDPYVVFVKFRGNLVDCLLANLNTKLVLPVSMAQGFLNGVLTYLQSGSLDAVLLSETADLLNRQRTNPLRALRGTSVYSFATAEDGTVPPAMYVADAFPLPPTWNAKLIQSPSGRVGNLWAVAQDGTVVQHDGAQWNAVPLPGGAQAVSVSVGQDGTVYAASSTALYGLSGNAWTPIQTNGLTLSQVAVGDANRIWVRDGTNTAHAFDPSANTFTPSAQIGTATHLAANADGTVWHCNADVGNANTFRYISEGQGAPEAIPLPSAASVQRVASTGFGISWCLAQQASATSTTSAHAIQTTAQLYQYTSPYIFKTSKSYQPLGLPINLTCDIAIGVNQIFVASASGSGASSVSALDVQTGQELWSNEAGDLGAPQGVIYDLRRRRVYFSTGYGSTDGCVQALDASGNRLWKFVAQTANIVYNPTLSDPALCFGDNSGNVYLINVDEAQALWAQGQAVQPVWTSQVPDVQGYSCGQPAFDNDAVYVAYQSGDGTKTVVAAFSVTNGQMLWTRSSNRDVASSTSPIDAFVGQALFGAGSGVAPEPALFVNAGTVIWILRLADNGATSKTVSAPGAAGNAFTSSMTLAGNKIYVGDNEGCVNLIDLGQFTVVGRTPVPSGDSPAAVYSNPELVTDSQGNTSVFFVRSSLDTDGGLWVWDPVSGNEEQLGLVDNTIVTVAYDAAHAVLYGASDDNPSAQSIGQVFAIRANQLVQDERAFIIESQLMQDFDAPTAGQTTAPAAVRYQTHVTLVDNNNVPMSNVPIKIWADAAVPVLVDGHLFQIDPNTPAAFQSDESGSFTITSGSVLPDGSDVPDVSATPLRLWAAFMDSQERIVVYPDSEFHARISTTVADASDDPQTINLATAMSYDGSALCSSTAQAQQTAQGIQTMTQSVSLGGTGTSSATIQRFGVMTTTAAMVTPPKYVAYTDLAGLSYHSADTPSGRSTAIAAPVGVNFSNATFSRLSASDAADQIDAMQGMLFQAQSGQRGAQLGSFSSDLHQAWSEIKQAVKADANAVKQAVVSIADVIYVGLQYVANGVTKVVKTVITDIADVATMIGAFFIQLGKDIARVLEALGRLFHLDEIFKVTSILTGSFDTFMRTMQSQSGLSAHVSDITNFVSGLEDNLDDYLSDIATRLSGSEATASAASREAPTSVPSGSALGNIKGMGTTPHSSMTVGPAGGNTPKQSQAVQGMWGLHKIRHGVQAQTMPQPSVPQDDPLSSFVEAFLGTLSSDQMNRLNNGTSTFTSGFPARSRSDFMQTAIGDILNLVEVAVHDTLDILQALVTGMLKITSDMLDLLVNGGPINIPIVSDLWKAEFGSLPRIIDLLAFVAAIPLTYLYRAIAGHWLSQDMSGIGVSDAEGVGIDPPQWLIRAQRIATVVLNLAVGIFTGINDTVWLASNGVLSSLVDRWVPWVGYALLLLQTVNTGYSGVVATTDVGYWSAVGLTLILDVITLKNPDPAAIWAAVSWILSIGVLVADYYADINSDDGALGLNADALANTPGVVSILKILPDPAEAIIPFLVPIADLACNWAAAGLTIAIVVEGWDKAVDPIRPRLFFPWMATGPTDHR